MEYQIPTPPPTTTTDYPMGIFTIQYVFLEPTLVGCYETIKGLKMF